jgi:hypothetical protein
VKAVGGELDRFEAGAENLRLIRARIRAPEIEKKKRARIERREYEAIGGNFWDALKQVGLAIVAGELPETVKRKVRPSLLVELAHITAKVADGELEGVAAALHALAEKIEVGA